MLDAQAGPLVVVEVELVLVVEDEVEAVEDDVVMEEDLEMLVFAALVVVIAVFL